MHLASYYNFTNTAVGDGGMAYYTSETCGSENGVYDGCTTDYDQSEVKYVVDAWAQAKFTNNELKIVDGYSARLVKYNELQPEITTFCTGDCYEAEGVKYDWMYSNDFNYWTMTPYNSSTQVWSSNSTGSVGPSNGDFGDVIRPVINVYKDKISS